MQNQYFYEDDHYSKSQAAKFAKNKDAVKKFSKPKNNFTFSNFQDYDKKDFRYGDRDNTGIVYDC